MWDPRALSLFLLWLQVLREAGLYTQVLGVSSLSLPFQRTSSEGTPVGCLKVPVVVRGRAEGLAVPQVPSDTPLAFLVRKEKCLSKPGL